MKNHTVMTETTTFHSYSFGATELAEAIRKGNAYTVTMDVDGLTGNYKGHDLEHDVKLDKEDILVRFNLVVYEEYGEEAGDWEQPPASWVENTTITLEVEEVWIDEYRIIIDDDEEEIIAKAMSNVIETE